MKVSVIFLSALLVAVPAAAQISSGSVMSGSGAVLEGETADLPEEDGSDATSENGERRICRRIETESHSRMSTRRVCLTARQWRERQRRN